MWELIMEVQFGLVPLVTTVQTPWVPGEVGIVPHIILVWIQTGGQNVSAWLHRLIVPQGQSLVVGLLAA